MRVIGIDAATRPDKIGLALGKVVEAGVVIEECPAPAAGRWPSRIVAEWLGGAESALIAVDAPLGWPDPLRKELPLHMAGRPLPGDPRELFGRLTDLAIRERLRKTPLEVGASWIARTSHAALLLLSEIEQTIGRSIQLAWETGIEGVAAIEVYPAATLAALGLPPGGYRKELAARERLLEELEKRGWIRVRTESVRASMVQSDHALDAALCVFTAERFLSGNCPPPASEEENDRARREGWIWCPA